MSHNRKPAMIVAGLAALALTVYVVGYFAFSELYEWRHRCYYRFFRSQWLCVIYSPVGFIEAHAQHISLSLYPKDGSYVLDICDFGPDPWGPELSD